jgi:hypothetical protein
MVLVYPIQFYPDTWDLAAAPSTTQHLTLTDLPCSVSANTWSTFNVVTCKLDLQWVMDNLMSLLWTRHLVSQPNITVGAALSNPSSDLVLWWNSRALLLLLYHHYVR